MYQLSLVVATATAVSFLAPYARGTRYEEAFLPKGNKRLLSPRSLGLASLLFERSEFLIATSKKKKLSVCVCGCSLNLGLSVEKNVLVLV